MVRSGPTSRTPLADGSFALVDYLHGLMRYGMQRRTPAQDSQLTLIQGVAIDVRDVNL